MLLAKMRAPRREGGPAAAVLANGQIVPFVLVAALFPLWGFANDITNPLVAAFKDIFLITNTQSSLVQFAFYLGYGIMAIPAALFIRIYSYKAGIVLGLGLYAIGALGFLPASLFQEFSFFLVSLCILTCGLALLETTANPYILTLGDPSTATQRLNLAQALNPAGSLAGMFVASQYILSRLKVEEFRAAERASHPEYADELPGVVQGKFTEALQEFSISNPEAHQAMQVADLATVRAPYLIIAAVVLAFLFLFVLVKLPKATSAAENFTWDEARDTFVRLMGNGRYREGVIAQAFYVGAQIMCWTFIIHYGMKEVGLSAAEAQGYNILAMGVFLVSRLAAAFLLGFFKPGTLLLIFASAALLMLTGVIFLPGWSGLYALVMTSACMSLMFPTIYGVALNGLGDDASLASAGLVMAIVGGALMPPIQAQIIDSEPLFASISSVRASFFVPMLSFLIVAVYGYRSR